MRSAADLEDASDKHPVTPGSIVPARELLGDMLLEANQPAEALAEYERSLNAAPNRFHGLAGAAAAAEGAGDAAKARLYREKLVQVAAADSDRPASSTTIGASADANGGKLSIYLSGVAVLMSLMSLGLALRRSS